MKKLVFTPSGIIRHFLELRELIRQLVRREVSARYKGSYIGLGWSLIHPLVMLGVYTFVFAVIFKARWGVGAEEGNAEFALALFMGLITFHLFADVVTDAPTLVTRNVNYVKKVVFPLEILPVVGFFSVLIHALFSLIVLFAGILLIRHSVCGTAILLPVVWLPLSMFSLGCGFFLASLGVFIRDIQAAVGMVTTILFFLSPIFYPLEAVPPAYRIFCRINPMAIFVEDARRVVLWGKMPDWPWYFGGLGLSAIVLVLGFAWFMKTKKAFADVL